MELADWSPVMGCAYASPGCLNCKAITIATGETRKLLDSKLLVKEGAIEWTGRVYFNINSLNDPIKRKEPTAFAVVPFGDLFYESIPNDWINRVFEVIEKSRHHAFQLQTKRSERMLKYVRDRYMRRQLPNNLFLGVSIETQDESSRIRDLINTPAAVRFITIFPPMGEIDLSHFLATGLIKAVFVGQEDWRPSKPEWIEHIKTDCENFNVQFVLNDNLVGEAVA